MGYKSVLRSMNASANKAAREAEGERKRIEREAQRLQKKIDKIEENLQKVFQALNDVYAKGKIDKRKYNLLKTRREDIGGDFIALAKTPGISLSKRYIVGKIDKREFKSMQKDLLPPKFLEEKDEIERLTSNFIKKIKDFHKTCKKRRRETCQKCSKEKSFLKPIHIIDNLRLCGGCKSELSKIQKFVGFNGNFLTADPAIIKLENIKDKFVLEVKLNPHSY